MEEETLPSFYGEVYHTTVVYLKGRTDQFKIRGSFDEIMQACKLVLRLPDEGVQVIKVMAKTVHIPFPEKGK